VLGWIGEFVSRWSGVVTAPIRDLVHWAVHALASVVYTVFGNVGGIWRDLAGAWQLFNRMLDKYLPGVWDAFRRIFLVDIPALWRWITGQVAKLWHDLVKLYDLARAYALDLYHAALHAVSDLLRWVIQHVLDPLAAAFAQAWHWITHEGALVFYYLTHPPALARLILAALIQAAEDAFWTVSGPILQFVLRLVLHNTRRLVQLAEQVIAAVL